MASYNMPSFFFIASSRRRTKPNLVPSLSSTLSNGDTARGWLSWETFHRRIHPETEIHQQNIEKMLRPRLSDDTSSLVWVFCCMCGVLYKCMYRSSLRCHLYASSSWLAIISHNCRTVDSQWTYIQCLVCHELTDSHTRSLVHWFTHPLTHSITHSLTHSPIHNS